MFTYEFIAKHSILLYCIFFIVGCLVIPVFFAMGNRENTITRKDMLVGAFISSWPILGACITISMIGVILIVTLYDLIIYINNRANNYFEKWLSTPVITLRKRGR